MKIIINYVKLKNFKGIADLQIDFIDGKNILEGENGIGKTTVLDAITWCLFGKNFADEKLFKIKPIIDGEEKADLLTSVELKLNDTTIERIWDNTSALIKVNGVKFKIKEFEDYLKENFDINDGEFKALSNIDFIPNLHWKELRSLVMGLIGEIKNEEVYEKGNFDLIKEKIESVGVEKTAEDIKSTKSNLVNDIKRLQGNIDQKTKDIQELVINDEEIAELESRKNAIKETISNYNHLKEQKAIQDNDLRQLEMTEDNKKHSLEEIDRLKNDNAEFQKTYDNSNIDVALIKENKIKDLNNKIKNEEEDIHRISLEKSALIAERDDLRKQYEEESKKEVKVENDKCSACGQPLPKEKIQEVLNKLKEESVQRINGFAMKAKEKLSRIEEIDVLIKNHNDKIEQLKVDIENVKSEELDTSQESDVQKQMRENIEKSNTKICELNSNIVNFDETIKNLNVKISQHQKIEIKDTTNLQQELEEITQKLATSSVLVTFKEQLKDLEKQYSDLLKDKELLNDREQQLILFNNTKAQLLRERVKHNFKLADFITQETTKDGNLVETFKIAVDGIEYNALNTGHKILVALDLIDNIQRMKDKRLPILIDGLGELTRLPEVDTQIIGCRAKFQANKKLEVTH